MDAVGVLRWTRRDARAAGGRSRALLAGLGLCAALLAACADEAEQDAPTKRPNILFILTDDQRWDSLGCYGNTSIRTPNMDALAAQGARFDAFYVAAPVCCPSRAAFLSGLAPHQSGVLNNQRGVALPKGTPTLATLLARAGYVTGFIGKGHVPIAPPSGPNQPGIVQATPADWGFTQSPVWLPPGASAHTDPTLLVDGVPKRVPGQITRIFTDAALTFLDEHQDERWLLWFAPTAPHVPYVNDPQHPYARETIGAPPGWPASQALSDEDWSGYYSTISMLDEQIGRLLERLDELHLADDTLVVLVGDNGWMFGSHGITGKQCWYDEATRVPALARWPGHVAPGSVVAQPVVSVDLLPTALELAGVALPAGLEGVSFLPALTGGVARRTYAYSEVRQDKGDNAHWQMLRFERWKYVRIVGEQRELLYDMRADPFEETDLAAAPEHAATLAELRQRLAEWLTATPTPGARRSGAK